MKTNLAYAAHDASGFGETAIAEIAAHNTAKVFRMLIRAYSRPIESAFREIFSNAMDATEAAGARAPRIVLPSRYDARIVFRDWGAGMSHDFVMKRAFSVGESTKEATDKERGGWGLGMKSPFATAETVTLRIWAGNNVQTYIITLQDGLPHVHTGKDMVEWLNPGDDGWLETGTEISWPTKEGQFSQWRAAAQSVLQWFPKSAYEIIGADIVAREFTYTSSTYSLMAGYAESVALIGGIAYPLDMVAISGAANSFNVPNHWPRFGLALHIPIGRLDIVPNRENLEYTPRTIQELRTAIECAVADVKARAFAAIPNCRNLWELQREFSRAHEQAGALANFLPNELTGLFRVSGFQSPPLAQHISASDLAKKRPSLNNTPLSLYRASWPDIAYLVDDGMTDKKPLRVKQYHATRKAQHYIIAPRAVLEAWGAPVAEYVDLSTIEAWRDPNKPPATNRGKNALPCVLVNDRSPRGLPWSRIPGDKVRDGSFYVLIDHTGGIDGAQFAGPWVRLPWYEKKTVYKMTKSALEKLQKAGLGLRCLETEARRRLAALASCDTFKAAYARFASPHTYESAYAQFILRYAGLDKEALAMRAALTLWNAAKAYDLDLLTFYKAINNDLIRCPHDLPIAPDFESAWQWWIHERPHFRAVWENVNNRSAPAVQAALYHLSTLKG